MPVVGLKEVINNLNKKSEDILFKTMKGVVRASLLILRESNRIVPVDLGNLRASGYIVTSHGTKRKGASPSFRGKKIDKRVTGGKHTPAALMKGAREVRKQEARKDHVDVARMIRNHAATLSLMRARVMKRVQGPAAAIGYSAYYGIYVHEDQSMKHKAGKTWKFLQFAIMRNEKQILDIIAKEAKI